MKKDQKGSPSFHWVKWLLGAAALVMAGSFFFIYGVLPGKVAQGLYTRSLVHKPIAQTPKDYGLTTFDEVSFKTDDGIDLSGWWIPAPKGHKPKGTLILSHGVFKNKEQMLTRVLFLRRLGYQCLLFDHRGHGASGNGPLSGGYLEAGDYLAAEKYLENKGQVRKPLVFFGFSLGAMSALRAAAKDSVVDGVIADSPLANIKSYVSRRTMGGVFSSMPGFLGMVLRSYDLLTGLNLREEDLDLTPVVQQLHELPVLYITGENDDLAKPDEVRRLFEKTDSHHRRLVYIPDAGHEETYKKFPVIYEKVVTDFLTDLGTGFKKSEEDGSEDPKN